MRIDAIKACLRMDVPLRIRYILEDIRPEAKAVVAALEILIRMARHSASAARSLVFDCRGLMDTLFRHFLPSTPSSGAAKRPPIADNLYNRPVRHLLTLSRILAAWDADLAGHLVTNYRLMEKIKRFQFSPIFSNVATLEKLKLCFQRYIAEENCAEWSVPDQEALQLLLECHATWRTLIKQLSAVALPSFFDFYPVWFPKLVFYQQNVSIDINNININNKTAFSHAEGAAILLLMESVLSACCFTGGLEIRNPHVAEVAGLRQPVEMCVAKWSHQLLRQDGGGDHVVNGPESGWHLLAAGVELLATFYGHWQDTDCHRLLNRICTDAILPLFDRLRLGPDLGCHSNLASSLAPPTRDADSLPSVSGTASGGQILPVLAPPTPFPLLSSVFRILRLWKTKCGVLVTSLAPGDSHFRYLDRVRNAECGIYKNLAANWFTRFEIRFVDQLLMSCVEWKENLTPEEKWIAHQAALTALPSISSGQEKMAADWIRRMVFNRDMADGGNRLESEFRRMDISGETLPDEIGDFYVRHLFPAKADVGHRTVESADAILSTDWIYLPLVSFYQKELEKQIPDNPVGCGTVVAERCLAAVDFLSSFRPDCFRMTPAEHYARLSCLFLSSSDLFIDKKIAGHMWTICRRLFVDFRSTDLTHPVSGISEDFLDL